MNNRIKRAASILTAGVMSLCFSVTAFAAPEVPGDNNITSGSLTVTGEQLGGKEVTAVRMFTARALKDGTSTNINFDSYDLDDEWLGFFKAAPEAGGIGKEALDAVDGIDFVTESDEEYEEAAVTYVQSLEDEAGVGTLAEFADKAKDWYKNNEEGFADLKKTETAPLPSEDETTSSVTFADLPTGYYIVFPELGSTGNSNRNTEAMLINVPTTKAGSSWNIKSTYPTVDKTVQADADGDFADNASASVGDTVTFKLVSSVPDMSDYTKYTFKFVDTLTNGLTFVPGSVKVSIGSVANDSMASYYEVTEPNEGSNTLTISFDNMKTIDGINTGDAITVTYNATINENAIVGDPAENEVKVEYSNNPDGTVGGSSTPDISKVYVYDIDVHKYTGSWNSSDTPVLNGATFVLSTSKENPVLEESIGTGVASDKYTDDVVRLVNKSGSSYRVATADDEVTTKEFTTAGAVINIDGLEAGTYYLHEIMAPEGYNKLANPIKIVIAPTITGEEPDAQATDYTRPIYTVKDVEQGQDNTVAVKNNKGLTLPETGSIGTIGLTVLGIVVVLVGVTVLPHKKDKKKD